MKYPCFYIIANRPFGVMYVGVTSNIIKRVYEHKNKILGGFTKKYNCNMLVYYELHSTMEEAISREKQIKNGSRKKKLSLIETMNPSWQDLYYTLF